jgi:hypothetical protein
MSHAEQCIALVVDVKEFAFSVSSEQMQNLIKKVPWTLRNQKGVTV